jgi:uncharacterized protein (TIGR03435 family)
VWLLSTLIKVTVILAIGLGALRLLLRLRAAIRHALLVGLFGIAIALPIGTAVMPVLEVRLPSGAPDTRALATLSRNSNGVATILPRAPIGPEAGVGAAVRLPATQVWLVFWSAGALLAFMPILIGLLQTRRLRASACPWPRGQRVIDRLARGAGLRRCVEVRRHVALPGPATCGVRRSLVIFPDDAQTWCDSDVERAAVHELEHVRRRDWMIDVIARTICAIYWFHPLIWVAWRQLRLESERAADDAVVRNRDATAYADLLITLAGRLVPRQTHVLAMASRRDLPLRVQSLLDESRARGRAGRGCIWITAVAAAAVVLCVAPMTVVTGAAAVAGQTAAATARTTVVPSSTIAFDVASIKVNVSADPRGLVRPEPGGLTVTNFTLNKLVMFAYGLQDYQLAGGTGWLSSTGFDISARFAGPLPPSLSPVEASRSALQKLLADRFSLVLHREPREVPALALVLARSDRRLGPRLKPSTVDCGREAAAGPNPSAAGRGFSDDQSCGFRVFVNLVKFVGQSMTDVAKELGPSAATDGLPVVDRTGLAGVWDADLTFTPSWPTTPAPGQELPPIDANGPSFAAAIQEQWGVKFERTKTAMTVLVVESAERPATN